MHRRLFIATTLAACSAAIAPGWAACTFELGRTASSEIQLLPAGVFRATDGRPEKINGWKMDAAIAARIIAAVSALNRSLVIDYEHQTLHAEANGLPAPAAGWFKTLEWREGKGLFAVDVEWTARAKEMIESGEYKYISPVFTYDKHGAVVQLQMAALTNYPGLDGMAEVLARAAARFNADDSTLQENNTMNKLLELLIATLGLTATATETDAHNAVVAMKANADKAATLETEVAALKSNKPDPTKFVPVETMSALQTQLAALTAQVNGRDIDEVVAAALTAGKLLPAQENWARELGKKDMAALKSFIDSAQPIQALQGTQTKDKKPEPVTELDAAQLAVCKALGISVEDFKKNINAQAAA